MSVDNGYVALRADGVSRVYGSRWAPFVAVKQLDFEVNSDSAIGIVGESGSGKSTLSRMLVGLESASSGEVTYNGANIAKFTQFRTGLLDFRCAVQFVAQDTSSSFDPRRTLLDAVATPLRVLRGRTGSEAMDQIAEVLRLLRLDPAHSPRLRKSTNSRRVPEAIRARIRSRPPPSPDLQSSPRIRSPNRASHDASQRALRQNRPEVRLTGSSPDR